MKAVCLVLAALALGCGKKNDDGRSHPRMKEPRTPFIENHGAKLMLPNGWRAAADEIYPEGEVHDRTALGDRAFAASDDRYEVISIQWLPTESDLCTTSKVGAIFENWAVKVDRIDALPGGCKISADLARSFIRHVGDHTLRFDCTPRDPALCDQLWPKIVVP
jgi:hypothetical protein